MNLVKIEMNHWLTTALPFILPEGVTCEGVNCPNGKQCALKGNGHQSGCVDPESDPCSPNPCQNGGTCNANSGDFTCSCASGYVGDDCGITSSSMLQAATSPETSEKDAPQTSVEYSSQLSQQHSIVTTQVNQQQSMELSTQKQRATQQTSESQQPSTLPSLEHLSLVTQQYSTMITQAYLPQLQLSVANIPLPSLQTLKTTYTQQQQSVGTSLITQVPPQPSGSYSLTQSQQETQLLSASQQAALLVSVEASSQWTQRGLSQETKDLSSPSKEITGQSLTTLQQSPTTSKEEMKSSSPSQPQQQQKQSNYPAHSQATKASSMSPVTHVLNGPSTSPGIEHICYFDICHFRIEACKT